MPAFSESALMAALKPPPARTVLPPAKAIFSKTSTFLTPASLAAIAAVKPAPPAPITRTSTVLFHFFGR